MQIKIEQPQTHLGTGFCSAGANLKSHRLDYRSRLPAKDIIDIQPTAGGLAEFNDNALNRRAQSQSIA